MAEKRVDSLYILRLEIVLFDEDKLNFDNSFLEFNVNTKYMQT